MTDIEAEALAIADMGVPLGVYDEAARSALDLAKLCEAAAGIHDGVWRKSCEAAAARHRERASWYLGRKALLETPIND